MTLRVSGGMNPPPIGPSFLQFSLASLFIPAWTVALPTEGSKHPDKVYEEATDLLLPATPGDAAEDNLDHEGSAHGEAGCAGAAD